MLTGRYMGYIVAIVYYITTAKYYVNNMLSLNLSNLTEHLRFKGYQLDEYNRVLNCFVIAFSILSY